MRRKDREMDREFGLEIIDKSSYGVLSMVGEEAKPYGLALSIVRDGNKLYFHSGKEGKKVEILKNNPQVWVTFVGQVKVPDLYTKEELDQMNKDLKKASQLISSVFTTEFESAMVKGRVEKIEKDEDKIRAMRLICQKYTPDKLDYFDRAIEISLDRLEVYSIEIEEISSKRKKFDQRGKEMKWGRRE